MGQFRVHLMFFNAILYSIRTGDYHSSVLFFHLLHNTTSYSFRGIYSFLNFEIQRSQYIRPKVTVHKGVETIQGRKLFKGGNYSRAETI